MVDNKGQLPLVVVGVVIVLVSNDNEGQFNEFDIRKLKYACS